jgi:hypothetical protein
MLVDILEEEFPPEQLSSDVRAEVQCRVRNMSEEVVLLEDRRKELKRLDVTAVDPSLPASAPPRMAYAELRLCIKFLFAGKCQIYNSIKKDNAHGIPWVSQLIQANYFLQDAFTVLQASAVRRLPAAQSVELLRVMISIAEM